MLKLSLTSACLALFLGVPGTVQHVVAQSTIRYTVAPSGNEARYYVREQLARIDFPSDAVGVTTRIEGALVITAPDAISADQSRFVIDLASLASDSDRRDGYVRRNTLQTEMHPSAVFVPTAFDGLVFPLPATGPLTFRVTGDLTLRGVTRPVTWDVTATTADGAVAGEARTRFTFADFELDKPRVASVLSVADEICLEYTFVLVAAP